MEAVFLNAANYMVAAEQYEQLQVLVKREQNDVQRRNTDATEQNTIDLLDFAQSKVDENRTRLEIGDVVQENSKIVAGIMNADGTEGEPNIKIGNVKATGSKGIIGYAKGVDLKGFFT
ncbi:hypothetical protein VE00_01717 [Pseudogymnoascus sp. WSF 3629]|nr:hypothetical protein VE00_01717 [Pseudogymnoascus sp. WSF 3629]